MSLLQKRVGRYPGILKNLQCVYQNVLLLASLCLHFLPTISEAPKAAMYTFHFVTSRVKWKAHQRYIMERIFGMERKKEEFIEDLYKKR